MSTVEARFYVSEITHKAYDTKSALITLQAVCRGTENKTWAAATPTGKIELTVQNPDAVAWFTERFHSKGDIAITFADRPLICVICKEEVGNDSADPDSYGFTTSSDLHYMGLSVNNGESMHKRHYDEAEAARKAKNA